MSEVLAALPPFPPGRGEEERADATEVLRPPWEAPAAQAAGSQGPPPAPRAPLALPQRRAELADGAAVDFPGAAESLALHVEDVAWELSGVRCRGALLLTDFRLLLQPLGPPAVGVHDVALPLEVPLGVLEECRIDRRAARVCSPSGDYAVDQLLLTCVDFRQVRVIAPEKGSQGALEVVLKALQAATAEWPAKSPSQLFVASAGQPTAGWDLLEWSAEFRRQGFDPRKWRQCRINQDSGGTTCLMLLV